MSYAQAREDLWLLNQFDPGFHGFMVDVGAYDGVTRSNSLMLEHEWWTVLCVEPQPDIYEQLRQNRAFTIRAACSDHEAAAELFSIHNDNPEAYSSLVRKGRRYHDQWRPDPNATFQQIEVPVRTLDSLLEQAQFPQLDAVSIDTEGTELEVLRGLDLERWRPHAMVIECWDEDGDADAYLRARGYRKVGRLLVDNLYVKED